jgi:hypothetical protein
MPPPEQLLGDQLASALAPTTKAGRLVEAGAAIRLPMEFEGGTYVVGLCRLN